MFGFTKKEAPVQKVEEPDKTLLELKVQILQGEVKEQRAMIRQLLKITTMISEHKRYELIEAELTKLNNVLDKIR